MQKQINKKGEEFKAPIKRIEGQMNKVLILEKELKN